MTYFQGLGDKQIHARCAVSARREIHRKRECDAVCSLGMRSHLHREEMDNRL